MLAPVRRSLNWKKGLVAAAAALALTAGVLAGLNREWIRSRWLATGPRIDSLAVLPLENLSGEASAGVLRRRHDGGAEHRPRSSQRAVARDGARIGHAIQGLEHAARSDRSRAERRCAGHGLGAAIGQARAASPRSCWIRAAATSCGRIVTSATSRICWRCAMKSYRPSSGKSGRSSRRESRRGSRREAVSTLKRSKPT